MTLEKATETLKRYNKWRRGIGKKYAEPGMPNDINPTDIGDAIDTVVNAYKTYLSPDDFSILCHAATLGLDVAKHFYPDTTAVKRIVRKAVKISERAIKKCQETDTENPPTIPQN